MEKFFNTAGPVIAENNYLIDPLKRLNKDEIMTSSLLALQDYINKEGHYKCLYVNIETAQTARSDVAKGKSEV